MNRRQCVQAIVGLAIGATSTHAGTARTHNLKLASQTAQKAFYTYYKMGGVLRFAVYDDTSGDDADTSTAVRDTLLRVGKVDDSALNALHPRRLNENQFFGDWYNPSNGSLVWSGNIETADGQRLTRPEFTDLNGLKIVSAGAGIPDIGAGGQFAYAFANPPYGLSGPRGKVQKVFDHIRETLLPRGHICVITDWASQDLDKVSDYFKMGKEWWGMFLFTIHDATDRRLTVIIGSATD